MVINKLRNTFKTIDTNSPYFDQHSNLKSDFRKQQGNIADYKACILKQCPFSNQSQKLNRVEGEKDGIK